MLTIIRILTMSVILVAICLSCTVPASEIAQTGATISVDETPQIAELTATSTSTKPPMSQESTISTMRPTLETVESATSTFVVHTSTPKPSATATTEQLVPLVTETPSFSSTLSAKPFTLGWIAPEPLDADLAREILIDELNDPDCQLPCFMGFFPGENSLEDVAEEMIPIAAGYGKVDELDGSVTLWFVSSDNFPGYYYWSFNFADEEMTSIAATYIAVDEFSINWLFNRFDEPSDIWLSTSDYSDDSSSEEAEIIIFLYYKSLGLFSVHSVDATVQEDYVTACLNNETERIVSIINPTIWDEAQEKSIQERSQETPGGQLKLQGDIIGIETLEQPLTEVTDHTISSLYQSVLSESEEFCFSTPMNLWPKIGDLK